MNLEEITLTCHFIEKWKRVLEKSYGYKEYMDFLIVPSLLGGETLCYLPLLNYCDKRSNEIEHLKELGKDTNFQIRALNFQYDQFKPNDTVTMRLYMNGKTSEEFLMQNMKSEARRVLRNTIKKYDYSFTYGNAGKDIDDFYINFSDSMYEHGTPVLSKMLLYNLVDEFQNDILFFNAYDKDRVVSSMCIFIDNDIALSLWAATTREYKKNRAGHFLNWQAVKYLCDEKNIKIFDFGRSPYGSGGFQYKSRFGAIPVKIDIISSQTIEIYSKYSLASKIWKCLPKYVVNYLGPKVCKYLVDL